MLDDRRETYYEEALRESGARYDNFDLLASHITMNLSYTYDVLHQLTARYMAAFGLSKSALNVLLLLRRGPPEGMQLHDLGELLLVSRANMTGLIDHLERKDHVKRVVDANDRRARFARITRKGEALLDEFMPLHLRNMRVLTEGLNDEEKRLLPKLLKKLRTSLTAHSEDCELRETCAGVG